MATDSWESLAHALASRVSHATYPCHPPTQDDCGYCSDYLAYKRYRDFLAAKGTPVVDPFASGRAISIEDIRRGKENSG